MGALLNLRLQQHAAVGAIFAVAPILALTITNLPKATARIPRALPITTYYLDSNTGKDENSGTSPHAPWKTLDRAGRAELQPGDRLLLSTRAPLRGCLRLKRTTGALGQPVRI